jgi:hypothetical protein
MKKCYLMDGEDIVMYARIAIHEEYTSLTSGDQAWMREKHRHFRVCENHKSQLELLMMYAAKNSSRLPKGYLENLENNLDALTHDVLN